MESAIASSVFRSPCTFSSHHIFCVLQRTSYYSQLRNSLLSRLICKTRTQSKRKWQPLPGPGLCSIPLKTYSFTPDSLFTYTDYVSCTTLVITALAISQSLRSQFAASSDFVYKSNIPLSDQENNEYFSLCLFSKRRIYSLSTI